MKKALSLLFYFGVGVLVVWSMLTVWVNYSGNHKITLIGDPLANHKELFVYNPDPIFNLDEQVCTSFAQSLSRHGFVSTIATTQLAAIDTSEYQLYIFCANTYNWAPDWSIMNIIKEHTGLASKNTIAITLGAGSTDRAQRVFEQALLDKKCNLLDSLTYWLLRPNDDSRPGEDNVQVATQLAGSWGEEIGRRLGGI